MSNLTKVLQAMRAAHKDLIAGITSLLESENKKISANRMVFNNQYSNLQKTLNQKIDKVKDVQKQLMSEFQQTKIQELEDCAKKEAHIIEFAKNAITQLPNDQKIKNNREHLKEKMNAIESIIEGIASKKNAGKDQLAKLGLTMSTINILLNQNITGDTIKYLSDADIDSLGISVIGDKVLLKKMRG